MQSTNSSAAMIASTVAWLETMRVAHARGEHEGHLYVTCPDCSPLLGLCGRPVRSLEECAR
jgi:hypothetical protein